jgi:glucose-induced degradation protein 8
LSHTLLTTSFKILDRNTRLHFSLLRLQLVELIRASFTTTDKEAVAKAIEFAQQNLAPYATVDPQFKNDLERAMALLIVPRESWNQPAASQATEPSGTPAPNDFGALSELVDPSLRVKVAKDVNEAILQSQDQAREAKIRYLVRARAWAENLAREKKVDIPKVLSLGLDGEDEAQASQQGNGHAAEGEVEMGDDDEDDDVEHGRRVVAAARAGMTVSGEPLR